jgi:isoaspartyl peptidase/L-asparaginase-like protein (Ntn-hydrolase superfamily)
LKDKNYKPKMNIENHDTISMIALDKKGDMVVTSTTSGLQFKMHGRVGDSPIIGAGIYVERGLGGAVCTGLGEAAMRTVAAHSVIEALRHGKTPQEACESVIMRMAELVPGSSDY